MEFSSLSAPCCAECEASLATFLCEDEDLLFCEPCSTGLHAKRARSHHIVKPLRVCDHCEKAVAVILCAPCGGRCDPLAYCSPCSSHLHSRKARAHHKLDRILFTQLSFPPPGSEQTNQGLMNRGGKSPFAESHASNSQTHMQHPLPCFAKKDIYNPNPNKLSAHESLEEEKIHDLKPSRKLKSRPAPLKACTGKENPRNRAAQKQTCAFTDGLSSSSEQDTSEDDETYGTKKYHKGSVTLEAFVVDVHDHEDGETNRGSCPNLNDDQPEGGVQAKIRKMLELGLHSDTPDIEAQQALKNAQRLLTKYNLQQADVLKGGLQANKHAFKGGMRMVELRSKDKSKQGGRFEHWVYSLALIVAKYFDTQYFVQKQSVLKVVFYGIRQNVDCAGYAFAATFNRISKLSADYIPSKHLNNGKASKGGNLKAGSSQNLYSRVSRMSYRNGLVEGLFETVKAVKSHKKPSRKPEGKKSKEELKKNGASSGKGDRDILNLDSDESDDKCGLQDASDDCIDNDPCSSCEILSEDAENGSSDEWGTDQSAALSALVVHSKKIGDDFLKEKKIKIRTRKQDSPIIWDGEAFLKGKRDSKSIDLGQKAITAKARKTVAG